MNRRVGKVMLANSKVFPTDFGLPLELGECTSFSKLIYSIDYAIFVNQKEIEQQLIAINKVGKTFGDVSIFLEEIQVFFRNYFPNNLT